MAKNLEHLNRIRILDNRSAELPEGWGKYSTEGLR